MILKFTKLWRHQKLIQNQISASFARQFHHLEVIKVKWERPDIGWIKLNFDGSMKHKSGLGSIGGVVRNHKGDFLLGYSEPIGKTTSTMAEITALRRGLDLALENGLYNVWFEGDEKRLLEIIANQIPVGPVEIQKRVKIINSILPEFDNYKMTHIYKQGNTTADALAKMGHQLNKPCIWRVRPPKEVLRLVQNDADGKIYRRTVRRGPN
ncbi:hypothetical protein MKW92_050290 [Papaver armeniacum]|nr:hypothetical protein MKW92_046870 [Papaver armeniacum]KAI3894641.1 hypothetical protein MKW92_050290 [Papaver armeniacum]